MSIKVTDRRMFDEKGELREGFRPNEESAEASEEAPKRVDPPPASNVPPVESARLVDQPASESESLPPREAASAASAAELDLQFLDLVRMLAEPAALYLGDIPGPEGRDLVDLDRARLHIDLLGLLQEKTEGNLSREEAAALDGLLYQLKMRFVELQRTR